MTPEEREQVERRLGVKLPGRYRWPERSDTTIRGVELLPPARWSLGDKAAAVIGTDLESGRPLMLKSSQGRLGTTVYVQSVRGGLKRLAELSDWLDRRPTSEEREQTAKDGRIWVSQLFDRVRRCPRCGMPTRLDDSCCVRVAPDHPPFEPSETEVADATETHPLAFAARRWIQRADVPAEFRRESEAVAVYDASVRTGSSRRRLRLLSERWLALFGVEVSDLSGEAADALGALLRRES